jgi:hypothetical protein
MPGKFEVLHAIISNDSHGCLVGVCGIRSAQMYDRDFFLANNGMQPGMKARRTSEIRCMMVVAILAAVLSSMACNSDCHGKLTSPKCMSTFWFCIFEVRLRDMCEANRGIVKDASLDRESDLDLARKSAPSCI